MKLFYFSIAVFLTLSLGAKERAEFTPRNIEFAPGRPLFVELLNKGQTIVAVTQSGELIQWNFESGKELSRIKIGEDINYAGLFNDKLVILTKQGALTLNDLSGKVLKTAAEKYPESYVKKLSARQISIPNQEGAEVIFNVPELETGAIEASCGTKSGIILQYYSGDCTRGASVVEGQWNNQRQRDDASSLTFFKLPEMTQTGKIEDFSRMPWGDFIGFSDDGRFLVHSGGNTLELYDSAAGKLLFILSGYFGASAALFHDGGGKLRIAASDWTPMQTEQKATRIYLYTIDTGFLNDAALKNGQHLIAKGSINFYPEPDAKSAVLERLSAGRILGYSHASANYCDKKKGLPWVSVYLANHMSGYICLRDVKVMVGDTAKLPMNAPEIIELTGTFIDKASKQPVSETQMYLKIGDQVITEFQTDKRGNYIVPVYFDLLTQEQRDKLIAGKISFAVLMWGREVASFEWNGPLLSLKENSKPAKERPKKLTLNQKKAKK